MISGVTRTGGQPDAGAGLGETEPAYAGVDVKTAGRTVDLFEVFAEAKEPLTLSELARSLGAPQSSCFNLVRALEARGYLYSAAGKKRLYPTRKLFEIAEAISQYEPLVPGIEPLLADLRDKTNETVILGARQGFRVVYLAVLESRQTIRYSSQVGAIKPMHASAAGKALLMSMSPAERLKLVRRLPLRASTERTITSIDALLKDIEQAAARGYAQTRGENVADVMAVACPVLLHGLTYAVAVAGPIGRIRPSAADHAAKVQAMLDKLG